MLSKSERIEFFINMTIAILMNCLFIALFLDWFDINKGFHLAIFVFSLSLLFLSFWNLIFRKPSFLFTIPIFWGILIIYLRLVYGMGYVAMFNSVKQVVNWVTRLFWDNVFFYSFYFKIFLVFTVCITCLFIFILIFQLKKTYLVLLIGTVIYLYSWFNFIDSAIIYYSLFIILGLFLFSFRNYKKLESIWLKDDKKVDSNIFRRWIKHSSIVCILVVFIASILPKNFEPVSWRWLDEKVQDIFPQLVDWRNAKKSSAKYGNKMRFDISMIGYQKDFERLGGPITYDKNILVMEVKGDESTYLRGRVKDQYTENYWKSTLDGAHKQAINSYIFTIKDSIPNGKDKTYTIKHKDIATSTIFNSYMTNMVKKDNGFYYSTDDLELFNDRLILKDSEYVVYSVLPYIHWQKIKKSSYMPKEEHERYLQIPQELPNRVKNLASQLTDSYNCDYEKVKAIVDYLRNEYEYTLEVPETPYDVDFVDYFLFDLRKGYCTYFASSLALMTRCIGIPSRYVEGFKMPEEKTEGVYKIYNNNAHAWTEVYIEGYGWMTFEATPSYDEIPYFKYIKENKSDNNEIYEDINRILRRERDMELHEKIEDDRQIGEYNKFESKNKTNYKYIAIITLCVVFLLRILKYIIREKELFNKVGKGTNRETVILYYGIILNLFNISNMPKYRFETSYEYANRVNSLVSERHNEIQCITDIFNKARYSDETITNKEVEIMKSYFEHINNKVKKEMGVMKFLFVNYIKGGIY